MDKLPLRLGKDFATNSQKGVILSLGASQAVLILAYNQHPEAWHSWQRISNIINGVTR